MFHLFRIWPGAKERLKMQARVSAMVVPVRVRHLDCNISKSAHKRHIPTTEDFHLMS